MNGCEVPAKSSGEQSGENSNSPDGAGETTDEGKALSELQSKDQEVILIQDTGFTIKIASPGLDAFDLQVNLLNGGNFFVEFYYFEMF